MQRKDFAILPKSTTDQPFLYALWLDDGLVKVGSTRNPRIRMELLFDKCRRAGLSISGAYIRATPDMNQFGTELRLVKACEKLAPPCRGREWFQAIDYREVMRLVDSVCEG